jgi:hypothetical protein
MVTVSKRRNLRSRGVSIAVIYVDLYCQYGPNYVAPRNERCSNLFLSVNTF